MSVANPQIDGSLRYWGARLLVLGVAIALGLALQDAIGVRLASIQELATRDVVMARAELASLLQIVGGSVFGMTFVVGVSMTLASRRALAAETFPPPGIWSWGSSRSVTGPSACRLARVWTLLALLVTALSAAGLGTVFYAAQVLLACKAA